MSFIRKTPQGRYAVCWRDNGKVRQKNFKTKSEAKKYEAFLTLNPEEKAARLVFSDVLVKYRDEVSSKKRGSREEFLRIDCFLRRPFAGKRLDKLTSKDFQDYVSARLEEPSHKTGGTISAGTVNKELNTLSAVFIWAVENGFIENSPISGVKRPKEPEHRWRVATEDEIEALKAVCGWDGVSEPVGTSQLVIAAFVLSCRTGMRANEIMSIEDSWIRGRVVVLPHEMTKTDSRRHVVLSKAALDLIDLIRKATDGRFFKGITAGSRESTFRKLRNKAGLMAEKDSQGHVIKEGLNFHDGRATFATWAAKTDPETGRPRLELLDLARQTGHKDLRMLQRYYRPDDEYLARRLD